MYAYRVKVEVLNAKDDSSIDSLNYIVIAPADRIFPQIEQDVQGNYSNAKALILSVEILPGRVLVAN